MNIFKRVKQFFSEESLPLSGRIFAAKTGEFNNELDMSYAAMLKLSSDERVESILNLVASTVQKSFSGVYIRPTDRYLDQVLDEKELEILNLCDKFIVDLKVKQLFFDYAYNITLHGDVFDRFSKTQSGITDLIPLPLNAISVIQDKNQDSNKGANIIVMEANFVQVRKPNNNGWDNYPIDQILHISYNNRRVWRKDIEGRITFGIWSIPPMACLQHLVAWKKKTIENDIIWKNKLLPIRHFSLSMPGIVPSKYIGTQDQKIALATADGKKLINDFKESVKPETADSDLITSDTVKAEMLEAKSTNYHAPNETIDQINNFMNTPMGVPNSFLGGNSGASQGIEMSAIFNSIRIGKIAEDIATEITKVLKIHLIILKPGLKDVIDRVAIHTNTTLSIEKFELSKTALAMSETGAVTSREIRESLGLAPIPLLPKEAFPISTGDTKASKKEMIKDIKAEGVKRGNNDSPQGERNAMEGT